MSEVEENNNRVAVRLDVIIRMLLDLQKERNKELTIGDQLIFLEKLGLSSTEAAKILGLNTNQLTSYRRYARMENKKVDSKS